MKEPRDWRDMSRWGEDTDYPKPDAVKAQLSGGSAEPSEEEIEELLGELESDRPSPTTWEDVEGVTFLDMEFSEAVYRGERCPTCGRMDNCCCEDCETCVAGIPRPSERRSAQ